MEALFVSCAPDVRGDLLRRKHSNPNSFETPMKPTIIAIDGGASGGIAWKFNHENLYQSDCVPMPKTSFEIVAKVRQIVAASQALKCPVIVYLENLVKHMGAGIPASTMAVYASNWGIIQGAVIYSGSRLELVTPQAWQKALGLGITGRKKADLSTIPYPSHTDDFKRIANEEKKRVHLANGQLKRDWKSKLLGEAQRLFPELAMAGKVTLKTADALLILEHGIRMQKGSV